MVTDGNSNLDEQFLPAYTSKAHETIEVFVVGISGLVNQSELSTIASDGFVSEYYKTTLRNFTDLIGQAGLITGRECNKGVGKPSLIISCPPI